MDQYKLQYQKGSGTFSVVFTALSLKTGKHVAIKCMKKKFDSVEKVKKLKQIQALNILSSHQNIIKMVEALYDQPSGKLALVFQLMQMNLYECLKSKKSPLTDKRVKVIMYQVLKAINYMHQKGIFHRDIKPENILIKDDAVKLADFGSCKGRHSNPPFTDYISTRWYRAPECLMTDGYYNEKMDIWGFGCVLFELITKKPLFPGKDQLDQVHRIHNILGTPRKEIFDKFRSQASHMQINFDSKKGIGIDRFLPGACDPNLKDILQKLLAYDMNERISAQQALRHDYFMEARGIREIAGNTFGGKFFGLKQEQVRGREMSQQFEKQSTKPMKNHSKVKNQSSKHNLQKHGFQTGLPKIVNLNPSNNSSNVMIDTYKRTFYGKKNSTNFNLTIFQQPKKKY